MRILILKIIEVIHSGVAKAFPGGRAAHPENQIEKGNEETMRKNGRKEGKNENKWGDVPLLPIRGWESGYAPGHAYKINASGTIGFSINEIFLVPFRYSSFHGLLLDNLVTCLGGIALRKKERKKDTLNRPRLRLIIHLRHLTINKRSSCPLLVPSS